MPSIDRRTLLKASALFAGAYSVGLAAASRFPAFASPQPIVLEALRTDAQLAEAASSQDLARYVL